jgi:threonyl-tRNA synthetase
MVSALIQPVGEASVKENRHLEPQDTQKLALIRYTCAHIMAMAVQKLYPRTKVAILFQRVK